MFACFRAVGAGGNLLWPLRFGGEERGGFIRFRGATSEECHGLSRAGSSLGVFEDLEDVVDEGFAFVGREVAGVDGLFVGLEVPEGRLLGEVLIYEADDRIDFLAGEAVTAPG